MLTTKSKGSPVLRWGGAKLTELFGADLRSLAALRIVLAVLVLADLASRAPDLYAHYTDRGVLPGNVLQAILSPWAFSLNLVSGEPFFQALYFGVTALAALALLVGYRTRLMTVVVWVLLFSLQWRNPFVLNAGDTLLRMLLFWGMFLPLGAYWSLDRARKVAAPRLSMHFLSFATVGLFLQIAFMYWFAAIKKSGPEWRVDGTALYYALSIDQLTTPTGSYLLQFPALLKGLTFATLGLEIIGPFLLFFPFFTGPVRTGAIVAFMSFHFGIWLTLDIGIFPWIGAFCMVCFLPSWFWNNVSKLAAKILKRPSTERRMQHLGGRGIFQPHWLRLQALLSPVVGVGHSSITAGVAADGGQSQSAAESVAERETRRSTLDGGERITLRSSFATNLLAFFFLLFVFSWNITTVSELKMPERLLPLSYFLGIDQSWGMYAPYPSKDDGWFVIPGTLRGEEQVDLMGVARGDFTLRQVSWEKPQYVANTYKNEPWRKYFESILSYSDQRPHFGRYICREWNARHTGSEELMTFQIVFMLEKTLPDYQNSTPQKKVLRNHDCFS
jgi:vitamin K-dependent gamma-carboxylase-like protein